MMVEALTTVRQIDVHLVVEHGVMTMKMIRSTSMTSTMGVTLMFELTFLPSSRLLIPIAVAPVWLAFSCQL
jgi:hypothetical protein